MRLGVARRKHRPNELPMDEETPLKEREASPNLDDDDASQSEDEAGPELSACGMIETWLRESLVMPLMSMYFVMLMINTLLRDTKDTLLVNSVAGVAAIPILKSWVTIPSSMLFFVLYSKLSHSSLSSRGQFLAVLICFSFFYILFAAVIYPFKHHISPSAWGQALREQNPKGSASATFASVAEEWTLGLFYVVCVCTRAAEATDCWPETQVRAVELGGVPAAVLAGGQRRHDHRHGQGRIPRHRGHGSVRCARSRPDRHRQRGAGGGGQAALGVRGPAGRGQRRGLLARDREAAAQRVKRLPAPRERV
jgi:hypothetical protein